MVSSRDLRLDQVIQDARYTHDSKNGFTFAFYIEGGFVFMAASFSNRKLIKSRKTGQMIPWEQFSREDGRENTGDRIVTLRDAVMGGWYKYHDPEEYRRNYSAFRKLNDGETAGKLANKLYKWFEEDTARRAEPIREVLFEKAMNFFMSL